jgi:D-glycero-beta-D-manno-heptose-7-phosphate kinase
MKSAAAVARRLVRRVSQFPGRRIAVWGDFMLDEFVWGRVTRVSAEAPVPVVEVTSHTVSLGGAGNVVANIRSLGGDPIPFGVVGNDPAGQRLRGLLRKGGIPLDGLLTSSGRHTTVKTRIIETARKHQVARTDRESREPLPPALARRLARTILAGAGGVHAVVVSDYDKGAVTPELLEMVLPALRDAGVPVLLDPRTRYAASYRPVTVITPNQREAEAISRIEIRDEASLARAGERLLEMLGCAYVLITRGERGMALFEAPEAGEAAARPGRARPKMRTISTMAREVYDVTGAGDTVIAALALAYAAGATMPEAAALANCAAGRAVAHVGTVAPTADEVCAALVEDARRAPGHPAWQI